MKTTLAILILSGAAAAFLLSPAPPSALPLPNETPAVRPKNGGERIGAPTVPAVAQRRPAVRTESDRIAGDSVSNAGAENGVAPLDEQTLVDNGLEPALERIVESGDLKQQQRLVMELVKDRLPFPGQVDVAWIEQLPNRSLRKFAVETLTREWGQRDLDAAWGWLEQIEDPDLQTAAMSGVVWNLARQDFESTAKWISEMEPSRLRDAAALKAAKILAIDRPEDAVHWASEFPDGSLQDQALNYGLHQWTAQNLDAAATWAIELDDAVLQTKALPMIAAAWGNTDPAAATGWVAEFPEDVRAPALTETIDRWVKKDPDTAHAWIANNRSIVPAEAVVAGTSTDSIAIQTN